MRTLLIISAFFVLSSCNTRAKDDDTVLISESILGSSIHLATFNGNSADKDSDCDMIARDLMEKYGRTFKCRKYSSVKKDIQY
jgi:hypothetical protein